MASQVKIWSLQRLLLLFSLVILSQQFEVTDEQVVQHSPEVAALHRLRGMPERMFVEQLNSPKSKRADANDNMMNLLEILQECRKTFPSCVIEMEKEYEEFVGYIEDQKVQLQLIHASEISQSYSQKLLVMTDKEESTEDRVKDEYSLDPHYSEIVSVECLQNSSCVPEADRNTVVKVFGCLSEDGQTVSSLSGSSLAEKMLNLSRKAVPLFSLDGNTTTEFQHSFLQTLSIHGIRAVIEMNQGKNQLYKVINQPESVFQYEIPRKKVDHSTQYDRQHILVMENGLAVQRAATYLYEKHPKISSVYVLDENQRPKLIHGDPVPLTEESRLVLVGHGSRANSGEMTLSGYKAKDIADIVKQTNRVGDKIKTTSFVACELGSEPVFAQTVLTELHAANIETKLHLRDALVQVRHNGEKITQDITTNGAQWQHKDDSKKVVAVLDKNGKVVFRNEPGSLGEPVFTNERNALGRLNTYVGKRFKTYQTNRPEHPENFLDQNVMEKFDPSASRELQALSWGLFHKGLLGPHKVNYKNVEDITKKYRIRKLTENDNEIVWIESEQEIKDVLSDCYEIKSGEDVRNIIQHYAEIGEEKITYLMVKDWIYAVDPKNLYVYPFGKKLDNNQIENPPQISEIERCIKEQNGKEKYPDMRKHIVDRNNQNSKERYVQNIKDIFLGERTINLPMSMEAWYTTYFTASVISESARNYRTFPLTLMALEMTDSTNNNIRENGLEFFFEEHPMARGNSWIDPSNRGHRGTATAKGSSKLNNYEYSYSKGQLNGHLEMVVEKEVKLYQSWNQDREEVLPEVLTIAQKYKVIQADSERESIQEDYNNFKENVTPAPDSGPLGGYNDGHTTTQDLTSASKLENSFRLESDFSRLKALIADQVHTHLKSQYGENLAGMHLQEGSARIEDGEFIGHLVSESVEPIEFRVKLSPESQFYNEKMSKGLDSAVHDLENHGSVSAHEVNKHVERTGTVIGGLGLMMGIKGFVQAFKQGDIEAGLMGLGQTEHAVASIVTSVVGKTALNVESRFARAASNVLRNPLMKKTMIALPLIGIGFGVYNFVEDIKRHDTLGYIDAGLDLGMTALDVLELAQPELAPFIAPINIALSVVRMAIDDIYMSIQSELQSLPDNATILDKVVAGFVGFGKGALHFVIRVISLFYDWGYEEIEEGRRLIAQISDYHKYYKVVKKDGINSIDFTAGDASWNGGGIHFCLADQGLSDLCMDYFVSGDESPRPRCWKVDAQDSKDIILGLGESHQLEHKTIERKILMFIPVGSVTVVSGYQTISNSRYGIYKGNRDSNRFFAIQEAEGSMTEVMLSYYYVLYGEPGDDTFYLGPQRTYVQGSGGKDTYIIPKNGGKTIINNYDPSQALDTLHFSVDYNDISVLKSEDHVVLMYEGSHTVTIEGWFLGEVYRHMSMVSGDGVLFEISANVDSSVQLVAKGINKMFESEGQYVDASKPLLSSVAAIYGTRYDDLLFGNKGKNLIDGGGGRDHLRGLEEEDIYIVKRRYLSSVVIDNYANDNKTDMAIIEEDLHSFQVTVEGDSVVLYSPLYSPLLISAQAAINVTLLNWFRSAADRHLLVVTKDLVTFKISDNKLDCLHSDPFHGCIKSLRVDYSSSETPQILDLQADQALDGVTEVRGSKFDDVIKGNNEHNVLIPGTGNDFLQGRGGQDWYVLTPGQGVKTINNYSPDLALDFLFLQERLEAISATCEGKSIIILLNGDRVVILQNWFESKAYQHLQIKTNDGITAELTSDIRRCFDSLVLPVTVDFRNQQPKSFHHRDVYYKGHAIFFLDDQLCVIKEKDMVVCRHGGNIIKDYKESVKEFYGSSGFDIIVGNSNDNLLDPYTGGALMVGGEGKDTYIIKRGYGDNIIIDNSAGDMKTDTVLMEMDFMDGGQVTVTLLSEAFDIAATFVDFFGSYGEDLNVTVNSKADQITLILSNYNIGAQYQHIQFQSSDGVSFKLKSSNSTVGESFYEIEAFKVTLKQSQVDCHLDLSSQKNLSTVHTVQGCSSQSNNIVGNAQDNILMGGFKDDTIEGGEGHDTLIGGNGNDLLLGEIGDDTLYGEEGDDTMMGGFGRDIFIPGPGADLIDGGPGRDSVLYRGDHVTGKGVYVNLLTGQGLHADAEGDVLKDMEAVVGTIYPDILVSGYESALLKGSDGNDILVSTGSDYLVGGDGNDVYLLAFQEGSVTIDNCAKDNATDVLYLTSKSRVRFDYVPQPDRVILNIIGFNQTVVRVTLMGWRGDHHDCGHLSLVFRGLEFSVDSMQATCLRKTFL